MNWWAYEAAQKKFERDKKREERRKYGGRFSTGGSERLTVNPNDDPKAPGGWYQSTKDEATGEKSTAVYDSDGNMPPGMGDNDKYV